MPGAPVETFFPDGEQWSVGLNADYEAFGFGVTYVKITSNTEDEGEVEVDNILVGGSFGWDAFAVGAFWGYIPSANGPETMARTASTASTATPPTA